jgi:hypothetical protein
MNMATLTWIIEWMQCKPVEGQYTDVVITAGWRLNGAQDTYNATIYGTCSFPAPSDPFTPYSDLTQQQVLNWCYSNGVNQEASETQVQQLIDNQINPPVVQLPLPWSA